MSHIEPPLFWCQHLLAGQPAGCSVTKERLSSAPGGERLVILDPTSASLHVKKGALRLHTSNNDTNVAQHVRAIRAPSEHDDRRSDDEQAAGGAHLNAGLVSWLRRAVLRCSGRESSED